MTRLQSFAIYFCWYFDCYCQIQSLISGRETEQEATSSLKLDIFLVFSNFLKSYLLSPFGTREATCISILLTMFHFILFYWWQIGPVLEHSRKFENIMSIIFWKIYFFLFTLSANDNLFFWKNCSFDSKMYGKWMNTFSTNSYFLYFQCFQCYATLIFKELLYINEMNFFHFYFEICYKLNFNSKL